MSYNQISDRFCDLVLHPKQLNDNSKYADLSNDLVRLVLPLKHLVELLQIVKFRETLEACLPQQVVESGQGLQVLWQVVMRSTLPWVGVSITEERIHQY